MIDEIAFKKIMDTDKAIIILGFVQLEERYNSLRDSFHRLERERNALLQKVSGVVIPDTPKPIVQPPSNRPKEPTVTPPPLDLSKIPIN